MRNQNTISNKTIYTTLLGSITKKGKKNAAKRIIDKAFLKASKHLKIPLHLVFIQFFLKLTSFIEVRKVLKKKNVHYIPFGTTPTRRVYLGVK